MDAKISTYRELIVWQKSMDLVVSIYALTEQFPKTEVYSLTAQMRRAAVSIPSNIAEGRRRGSRKDFRHFLVIAYGSGSELETKLEIGKRVGFQTGELHQQCLNLLEEVMKMLNKMIANLQPSPISY